MPGHVVGGEQPEEDAPVTRMLMGGLALLAPDE